VKIYQPESAHGKNECLFWQAFSIGIGNTVGSEAIPPLINLQTIATGQSNRRHDSV
jgi:hypothetical protein